MRAVCSVIVVALLLCFSLNPSVQAANQSREAKLAELKQVIRQLQSELASVRNDRDKLLQALQHSEQKIAKLKRQAKALQQQLNDSQTQLLQLQQQQQTLATHKRQHQQVIAQQLVIVTDLAIKAN